jgi:hypothetical protein
MCIAVIRLQKTSDLRVCAHQKVDPAAQSASLSGVLSERNLIKKSDDEEESLLKLIE